MNSLSTVTTHVLSLGINGEGLIEHEGEKYYVPYTAPGDLITGDLVPYKGKLEFHLDHIVTPASSRASPVCSHFGTCGGCKLQHLSSEDYTDFKTHQLSRALEFHGVTALERTSLHIIPQGHRRRISLTFAHRREGLRLGYVKARSKSIVDVVECPLIHPHLQNLLPFLRDFLASFFVQRESGHVDLILSQTGIDLNIKTGYLKKLDALQSQAFAEFTQTHDLARISLNYRPVVTQRSPGVFFGDVFVEVEAGKFLQSSDEADRLMLKWVGEMLPSSLSRGADLFSGRGTFTFLLAERGPTDAFECEQDALSALEKANQTKKAPIYLHKRDLFTYPLTPSELSAYDCVVVDPPRAGALAQVEHIGTSSLTNVIYISCHGASFARDARILQDHGFSLTRLHPLDQFLWSEHLEIIAQFQRPTPALV